MCESDNDPDHYDHAGDPHQREDHAAAAHHDPSRRWFLGSAGLLVAGGAAAGLGIVLNRTDGAKTPILSHGDEAAFSQAMHIHTSFSEGPASLATHINQAENNKVDVLWKTDHDWRAVAHGAPMTIDFTSLDSELVAGGRPVHWRAMRTGALAQHTETIGAAAVNSLNGATQPGSMHVAATSVGAAPATTQFYADFVKARMAQRTNLTGQTLTIDVLVDTADGTDSYLELLITASYHPAVGGRPAGKYQLSYRFGDTATGMMSQQLLGIVHKQVSRGQWQTVTINPVADIAALWPDLQAEDNSLYDLWLGATSTNRKPADGYFAALRFQRTNTKAADVLATEKKLIDTYGSNTKVVLKRAHEVSFYDRHITAFGTDFLPEYTDMSAVTPPDAGWGPSTDLVKEIHSSGGIASFNHPFGTRTSKNLSSSSDQAAALQAVFAFVYKYGACGADIFEVGFQQRGGLAVHGVKAIVDMATHQALWDMMSRNGFFLTANGVTDDHYGTAQQWVHGVNRFLTYTWSSSSEDADLMDSLVAGRAWVAEMGSFRGTLDLRVDDVVSMGQASVRPGVSSRQLEIQATGLPSGSTVRVLQGPIDNPGAATKDSGTRTIATVKASDFTAGTHKVALNTRASSFVRLDILDHTGRTIGFSNPVYLLQRPPSSSRPIPKARLAADSSG